MTFVVTLAGSKKRIVFEMKHKDGMSLPAITKELNGVMETRDADYGVLISRNRNHCLTTKLDGLMSKTTTSLYAP